MGAWGVGGAVLSVPVLEDGGDRFVGTGIEQKGTGAGGIDAFVAIALDQPRMPMAERQPCSGCGCERGMTSISVSASGPTLAPSERMRSSVRSR